MDEKPETAARTSRRRWYQYSLRTLMTFVTLAGCGFAWLGIKVREAREQQADVDAIRKLGGEVHYDYEFDAKDDRLPNPTIPGPAWLRAILGDDFFRNIHQVVFAATSVTDADLRHLDNLTQLDQLSLIMTPTTDAGLEHLKGLSRLRWLYLYDTKVTDGGVAKLQKALPTCKIMH